MLAFKGTAATSYFVHRLKGAYAVGPLLLMPGYIPYLLGIGDSVDSKIAHLELHRGLGFRFAGLGLEFRIWGVSLGLRWASD